MNNGANFLLKDCKFSKSLWQTKIFKIWISR